VTNPPKSGKTCGGFFIPNEKGHPEGWPNKNQIFCILSLLRTYKVYTMLPINITYNNARRLTNIQDHKVDFLAVESFEFDSAVVLLDNREYYGEDRFQAIGFIGIRLYFLVYTVRGDALHIISLRKATKKEEKLYVSST
jgi:uncharacterized protein